MPTATDGDIMNRYGHATGYRIKDLDIAKSKTLVELAYASCRADAPG